MMMGGGALLLATCLSALALDARAPLTRRAGASTVLVPRVCLPRLGPFSLTRRVGASTVLVPLHDERHGFPHTKIWALALSRPIGDLSHSALDSWWNPLAKNFHLTLVILTSPCHSD